MIALAVAAAMAMPIGGQSTPPPAAARQPPVIGMAGKVFHPGTLDVVLGDTVTWDNDDGVAHEVASAAAGFDSGRLGPGARFSYTPTAQGTIAYRCTLHFFMAGQLAVHGLGLDAPAGAAHPGAPVTLTGRAPKDVADVTLEERAADGTWSAVARAAPAADGAFSAAIAPAGPVVVRARSGDLLSREVHVSTAPEVAVRAVRRGRLIVVRVRTTPPQPGARVRLDHWNRERFDWRPSLTARLDARSRATLVLRSAAWQRLRVVVTRGVDGYGPGGSRALRVAPLRRR